MLDKFQDKDDFNYTIPCYLKHTCFILILRNIFKLCIRTHSFSNCVNIFES